MMADLANPRTKLKMELGEHKQLKTMRGYPL
jgi:hypothetical protein